MKIKVGVLRKIVAEERVRLKEMNLQERHQPNQELENKIAFAMAFANIPARMRLDVGRVVAGEYEKVNPEHIHAVVDIIGNQDEALDDALASYVEYIEGQGGKQQEAPVKEEGYDAVDEVAPPGGEKVVKALKKEKGVENPYAVAWSMKNKGAKFKR